MLCFKASYLCNEFRTINPRLRAMIFELSDFLEKRFGVDGDKSTFRVTSFWRKNKPKSVHAHGRGCDFGAKQFALGDLYEIESYVNENFPYGKKGKASLIFHSKEGTLQQNPDVMKDATFHGHLQVKSL